MEDEKIKEIVGAYSLKEVYEFISMFFFLEYKEVPMDDFIRISKELLSEASSEKEADHVRTMESVGGVRCSRCNSFMLLFKVDIPQGRGNLYGWKSVYRCFGCGHEKYNKKPVEFYLEKTKKKRTNRKVKRRSHGNCY